MVLATVEKIKLKLYGLIGISKVGWGLGWYYEVEMDINYVWRNSFKIIWIGMVFGMSEGMVWMIFNGQM